MPEVKSKKYFLPYSTQTCICRGIYKKISEIIWKRSDLAALYSLVGKEGWQERKNPEFCCQFTFS